MSNLSIEKYLSTHYLFFNSKPEFILKLSQSCKILDFDSGEILFTRGEVAAGGYIVLTGLIRLYIEGIQKNGQTLRFVTKDEAFAEPMMFGQELYPVSAESIGKSRVLLIRQETIIEELSKNPDFALSLLRSLSVRLKYHVQTIKVLSAPNPMLRLLMFLQDNLAATEADQERCGVNFDLSRKDLASQLNIAPETLSRINKILASQDVVELKNHRIRYVNFKKMDLMLVDLLRESTKRSR